MRTEEIHHLQNESSRLQNPFTVTVGQAKPLLAFCFIYHSPNARSHPNRVMRLRPRKGTALERERKEISQSSVELTFKYHKLRDDRRRIIPTTHVYQLLPNVQLAGCYVGSLVDTFASLFEIRRTKFLRWLLLARVWVVFCACLSEMVHIFGISCENGHVRIHTRTRTRRCTIHPRTLTTTLTQSTSNHCISVHN